VLKDFEESPQPFVVGVVDVQGSSVIMTNCIKQISEKHPEVAILLLSADDQNKNVKKRKVTVVAHAPADALAKGLKANDWAKEAAVAVGGKGGGREGTAQGSGPSVENIGKAAEAATAFASSKF
tara:strand:+ start:790 stop:1161 length:372 start_codon:yes stop_codon:yes gene_type:complete